LKKIGSEERKQAALRSAVDRAETSLRATYFGSEASLAEPFAAVHEREDD